MPKLKKTKSFTVSEKTDTVEIEGAIYEIANLEKSRITNPNIILININDVWEEINVLNLGAENSNLKNFINFVSEMNITMSGLGFKIKNPSPNYSLKHQDFMDLQIEFPQFDYISISKLNDNLISKGLKTSKWELRGWLNALIRDKKTIQQFINENQKQMALKESIQEVTSEVKLIESNNEISIEVFSSLTPEKIKELQGIKEKQDLILKENPFIKVTDKITLETAKKSRAALLSASTSTEAIETNATKFLNTFKGMIKTAIYELAKPTRQRHKLQDDEIKSWENAEAIRIAQEEREKLEKIQKRTNELFAIPMTFNGQIYSIGTLYVLPSQIEGLDDEKFLELVNQGKVIAKKIEDDKLAESKKDQEIAELKAKLEALSSANGLPAEEIVVNKPEVISPEQKKPAEQPEPTPQKKQLAYQVPEPANTVLNAFDMQHAQLLENQAFLKYREGFIKGSISTVNEIIKIIDNGGKSKEIRDFAAIINQTKF